MLEGLRLLRRRGFRQPRIGRLALTLLLAAGCASNSGVDFAVRLQTDLVPGVEFDEIIVRVDEGREQREPFAGGDGTFETGRIVARYTGIPSGMRRFSVDLMRRDVAVAEGARAYVVSGGGSVTIVITRSCGGRACVGDQPQCQGGRCVSETCTPENPASCPEPTCTLDEDCPTPPQSCFSSRCVSGFCFDFDSGSCGEGNYCDADDGCRPTGVVVPPDGGVIDAATDSGRERCTPACAGFSYCEDGSCVDASTCLSTDECPSDFVCRNRRCLPPDVDIDGDGSTAADDCDEGRADAFPGADEKCNDLDDDCDGDSDEGNPGVLCAEEGGECISGSCGCPPGQVDVDGVPDTGCECEVTPAIGQGGSCAEAIDLGRVDDTEQMMVIAANALPMDRELWYRVIGGDTPDTSCDNYYFRARFTDNPDDAYRFEVIRESCDAPADTDGLCRSTAGFTDYSFATDFYNEAEGIGECPCAPDPGITGRNICNDNTATHFIRVFRRGEVAPSCAPFALEISNGLFDTAE
ncbi:MAG: hypothetical protein AAF645_09865 [Myxococcota bacterium]